MKFEKKMYQEYWKNIHKNGEKDICCVCFPDKPVYFNRFFDRIQKHIIKKYINDEALKFDGKKLLDVGCGRGRWLSFFQDYGAQVTGIDLSEDAVNSCKNKGFQVVSGSIDSMKMFSDNQFDYVTSITVLLHLPYDIKTNAIREIGRVVKKGGKVIIIENTWDDPSPHVFSYSVSRWKKEFEDAGLVMVHKSAHCFNLCRRKLPCYIPIVERISIYMDYVFDYALMRKYYGKQNKRALQHFMVFEKR